MKRSLLTNQMILCADILSFETGNEKNVCSCFRAGRAL